PQARDQPPDLLPLEGQVRRVVGVGAPAVEGAGGGERQAQADVRGAGPGERRDQGRAQPKTVGPSARRGVAAMLVQEHRLSVVRACQLAGCSRTAWYRPAQDRSARDAPVIAALTTLVTRHARWGFWLCFDTLRGTGHGWNWKRVHRVYCALGLNLPRRGKKRVLTRERLALEAPAVLNRTWALDFMGDTLYDGRCYRLLTVLDEGNREALAIEVGTSLPSVRVVQVLEQLVAVHGAPGRLRCDNGPEFIAHALARWCE